MSRSVLIAVALASTLLGPSGCGDNLARPDAGFDPWLLEDLTGDQGVSLRTPEFEVPSGTELQDCYFVRLPDIAGGADVLADRLTLALNPGSHHFNVFRVRTIAGLDPAAGTPVVLGPGLTGTVIQGGECWKSSNWSDWPLVINSQESNVGDPILDWRLPAGVATRFAPGELLMLQIHYVNASTQETPYRGRGGVNIYRSTDGDSMELGTLFATQQSIRVCRSAPQPFYSGSCAMPAGSHTVAAANGHFHSRGRRFQIFSWDGTSTTEPPADARFYDSDNWAEPDMDLDLSVALPPTGGIWWRCDFQWTEPSVGCEVLDQADPQQQGDCCYTFGPKVESSEHCNVFLYYYPKVTEDIACF